MHLIQEKTKNLANKESAKILVISDSHGQTRNLRSVLEAQKNTCDALVFTGDGIMDLITIMEEDFNSPPEHKILPQNVIFVRGNGDSPYYNFLQTNRKFYRFRKMQVLRLHTKKFLWRMDIFLEFIIQPRNCSTILKKTDLTQDFSAIRTCHLPDFQMIFCF